MKSLRLLTWPDYIDPLTLEQFEHEFNTKVELEIVPSAAELIERMRADGPAIDVLCPPDYAVRELGAERRLRTLDHTCLPNLSHLENRFRQARAHDPESRVSVIKDWGTTGFMYRTDIVPETPQSWADFWTLTEKYTGLATVLDSPGEVIGAALKMRGHSYNAWGEAELAVARLDLLRLELRLRAFETNYKPLLASGEACLSLGWNGDAAALKAQGVPIRYVIPSEGSQLWEDDWAVAQCSSEPEMAHDFLNFVLRPEIAAQEARYTRYATGNRAARALLDEELRSDPSTYPPDDVLQKLEAGAPLPPEGQKRRDQLWQDVRG
jgi:spermidine/putrescine transport system substrate-binding protein